MSIPRRKTSIRGLMIVVALVGFSLWGRMLVGRSVEFSLKADHFAKLKKTHISYCPAPSADIATRAASSSRVMQVNQTRHDDFESLETKYRKAAYFPWLTLEPDPPEPRRF